MIAVEMFLLDTVLKYSLSAKKAMTLKIIFYGFQFFVVLSIAWNPQLSAQKLYAFCFFPMTQFAAFGSLAL